MATSELETKLSQVFVRLGISSSGKISAMKPASGGCINDAFVVETADSGKFFVKSHVTTSEMSRDECKVMLQAEMDGLEALRQTHAIRVPKPLYVGELTDGAFLITEYISIGPLRDQRKFGRQLAEMHLFAGPSQFGFAKDNWIGSTPQINGWHSSWVELLYKRLKYQFGLAQFTGNTHKMGMELLQRLPEFFEGVEIKPSLVHGDLWSGNCGSDESGNPVIFDPAVYWGHNESELGIMRMFGGYTSEFYDAYHELIPRAPGFNRRVLIYELYHAVNHYNLFGSGYWGQCQHLLRRILG
ncbi:hypothetical protein IWW36_004986 [Coemansia brasiliensis]|uniref:protein-ribulosamine 3-kinase n=1 Tax=Coemansia brasiliensis TaxID=2650707 RepID=A0A9W8LVS8_9FUNG|nr:hypothetical protein IWW36_004986 [Coemansia brasiliensis]